MLTKIANQKSKITFSSTLTDFESLVFSRIAAISL